MIIYKYTLRTKNRQIVEMPLESEIKTAQMQRDKLCLWVQVEEKFSDRTEPRLIEVIGTGEHFNSGELRTYIATVQDGTYVWHVFELFENKNPS